VEGPIPTPCTLTAEPCALHPLRSHTLWKGADENETIDCLETFILRDERVYECILDNMGADWKDRDAHLERRLWCLQFLRPEHLDVKKTHAMHPALQIARSNLRRFSQVKSPREKLECNYQAAQVRGSLARPTANVGYIGEGGAL